MPSFMLTQTNKQCSTEVVLPPQGIFDVYKHFWLLTKGGRLATGIYWVGRGQRCY